MTSKNYILWEILYLITLSSYLFSYQNPYDPYQPTTIFVSNYFNQQKDITVSPMTMLHCLHQQWRRSQQTPTYHLKQPETPQQKHKREMRSIECMQNYGLPSETIDILFRFDINSVKEFIIDLKEYINKRQALKIWHDYSQTIWFSKDQKKSCQKSIEKAFTHYEEQQIETQRKLEDQQKLLTIYNNNILYDSPSSYREQRATALKETINQNGKIHIITHNVNVKTQALMQLQNIDHHQFQNISGTLFAHQLFQECADHYQKIAKIFFEYSLKNSNFVSCTIACIQTAFDGTKQEQFALAVRLSDLAQTLASTSLSICKGVIESGCSIIDMIQDPKPVVTALMKVTQFLGGALAHYDHEGLIGIIHLKSAQKAFQDDLQTFNQICDIAKQHFYDCYKTSNTQDKIQASSKLLADFTTTPFVLGKAFKCCCSLLKQAKNAVIFERSIELAEELGLGFQEAEELLLTTANDVSIPSTTSEIETAVTSLMEGEIQAAQNTGWFQNLNSVDSFVETLQTIRAQNALYKNNDLQKKITNYFEQYMYTKELCNFYNNIQKSHNAIMVEYTGKQAEMVYNLKHLFLPELDFKTSTRYQNTQGTISGCHTDKAIKALQENKFIKILSQEELIGGCKAYKLEHIFGNGTLQKTVWPADWSAEKILQAIQNAWHNPIYINYDILPDKSLGHIVGVMHSDSNDILITIYVKKLANESLKLKTAYPYWEKVAGLNLC